MWIVKDSLIAVQFHWFQTLDVAYLPWILNIWAHPECLKTSAFIKFPNDFNYKPDGLVIPCTNLSLEQGNIHEKHVFTAY